MIIYRDHSDHWGGWIPDLMDYTLTGVGNITHLYDTHYGFHIDVKLKTIEHVLTADTKLNTRWHVGGRTYFIRDQKDLMEFQSLLNTCLIEELG